MRKFSLLALAVLAPLVVSPARAVELTIFATGSMADPLKEVGEDFTEEVKLGDFGRRAVLALRQNLVSRISELEKDGIYRKYKDRGFTVLGFPSNDFGNQEPGSGEEIAKFCKLTYGVEFPMFEKAIITSKHPSAPYPHLIKATGQTPQWNFHKYLVSRDGKIIKSFSSEVTPDTADFVSELETLLAQK